MSACGFFEMNTNTEPMKIIEEVRRLGFPSASIERPKGFLKEFLIDLQSFMRMDHGTSEDILNDLELVARYLISTSSDGEVLYSQDLDLRDPRYVETITPREIRKYPPDMSGTFGLYLVKEEDQNNQ